MVQAFFVFVGVAVMGGALVVGLRRRVDDGLYGSTGAFAYHVIAMFLVGAAFVAFGTSILPMDVALLTALALAVGDVVIGVVARRRVRAGD